MLPSFGSIFGEPISAYFGLLLVAFAAATLSLVRWAKRVGVDPQSAIDFGLASVVGGVLGGRLLHVLADGYFWDYVHLCSEPAAVAWRITEGQCREAHAVWDAARGVCHPAARDCLAWAKFYNGGLAYYGGLMGGTLAVALLARRDGVPFRKLTDGVAPAVALGLSIGRIGCFLAGCCYGEVTALAVGTRFPAWSPASEGQFRAGLLSHPGESSLPVHPTQLYESLGCLLLAIGLARFDARKRFEGQVALLGLIAYAALRILVELVHADDRGVWVGVSTSQWLSLAVVAAAARVWRKWARTPQPR